MIGSVMVSYVRARSEALGATADIGLMQRPERVILIGVSAIACGIFSVTVGNDVRIVVDWLPIPIFETISLFTLPIVALAFLTNYTAIARLMHSKKELESK
jgi:CDP-diacylglycerol--glycerol-3-phosphate 3-phosphatidyltransferase